MIASIVVRGVRRESSSRALLPHPPIGIAARLAKPLRQARFRGANVMGDLHFGHHCGGHGVTVEFPISRSAVEARRLRWVIMQKVSRACSDFNRLPSSRAHASALRHQKPFATPRDDRPFIEFTELPLQRGHHGAQSRPNFDHGNFSSFRSCIRAVAAQAEIKLSSGRYRHRLDVAVLNVSRHFVSALTGGASPLLCLVVSL